MKLLLGVISAVLLAQACGKGAKDSVQTYAPSQQEVNRSMESINRQMAMDESAAIDGYVSRQGWEMTQTGTGLRYMVYEQGPMGPLAEDGKVVTVAYEVSLISGEVVYSSSESGNRTFMIGQDNVETGIHEAINYLKVGDKAKIVLPSHLAHGLTGDNNKIPPRSTVIYDLHLLSMR